MKITVIDETPALGLAAAEDAKARIQAAIAERGVARIVLSTGASQLPMLEKLIQMDIDWSKVVAFHLDEYIGIPDTHIASFRKYLRERFASQIPLGEMHYVIPEGDIAANMEALGAKLREAPIDVGFIGIGENAHIAFNDPPAEMDNPNAYKIVDLNETCKKQQVREGWFASIDEVPKQAISMTVLQILACRSIISFVPYAVKAAAIHKMLTNDLTADVPATALKGHPDCTVYLDADSASLAWEQIKAYV